MLSSFYIKNYRNLKELHISSFNQVNLISGKNNTGKSSLLEAIFIYANRGSVESIVANFIGRKEYFTSNLRPDILQENITSLSSLFFNRKFSFNYEDRIEIGEPQLKDLISLQFVYYKEEVNQNAKYEFEKIRRITIDNNLDINNISDLFIGFDIKIGNQSKLLSLQKSLGSYVRNSISAPSLKHQFIYTNNSEKSFNSSLFDNIALTDKEQYIIEALRIIEPNTERIAFVDNNMKERVAVVKLANTKDVVSISSMGDGINRILTIILSLVNCSDGYLLIDEFENGLHYTVQEKLWTVIFKLAQELNIQIFATTHSNDCISSFSKVLNNMNNKSLGKYIRLDNVDGQIKQVEFSSDELNIADQQEIEIR
ncbi:ATP/GTP-binding protein [Bacteroides sp. 51]|uniref:AAA family ATPase n=1 Tax=Bacteroides sp. 51 TaxID=2302938 RepID=UPI0013D6AB83|nr:ATP-binding protein [Bacteroides sp. 51]NDV81055.1 hypothetical protein [Bacteroides sp. 51]